MKYYSNKYIFMALSLSARNMIGQTGADFNSVRDLKLAKSTKEAISNLGEGFKGFSWNGALQAGTLLSSGISDLINSYDTSDIEQFEKDYNKMLTRRSQQLYSGINSFDTLTNRYSNLITPKELTDEQLGILNGGQVAGSILGSTINGAAAGAAVGGPIGAAISGFVMGGLKAAGLSNQNKKRHELKTELMNRNTYEYNRTNRELANTGQALKKQQLSTAPVNPYAFGGALEYDFIQQSLMNQQNRINSQSNRITSMPNSFYNEFALGGTRNGGYFSNGLIHIGEGGTHEQNPYEGVLIGYDEQGTPNLVEEGEYIWNDYVFSNRTKVPKEVNNMFGLGGKKDGYSFAEAVDFLQKESEERPNDPISKNGLMSNLYKLMSLQENIRQQQQQEQMQQQANKFSGGGFTNQGIYDFSDISIYGERGDDDKVTPGDEWKKVVQNLADNPDYIRQALMYGRKLLSNSNADKTKDDYKFFTKLFNNKHFKKLTSEQSIKDYTDDQIKALEKLYTDGAPGLLYELARVANAGGSADTPVVNTKKNIQFMTINDEGNVVPIQIDGKNISWTGDPKKARTGLSAVTNATDKSVLQQLQKLYNIDPDNLVLDLIGDEKDNNYRTVLSKKEEKKPSIYKAQKEDGTWVDVNVTDLNTNPLYEGFAEVNSYVDEDGNKVYQYAKQKDESGKKNALQALRITPIAGNLGSTISDALNITNVPNYEFAESVGAVADNLTQVDFTPIGQRLFIQPYDNTIHLNNLISQSAATKKSILNNSGLNRGAANAGLIAQDYNTLNSMGELNKKMQEAEIARQEKNATFNRGTEQMNQAGIIEVGKANQSRDQLMLQALTNEAKLKTEEKLMTDAAKAANLSNLFNSMSDLGREIAYEDMIKNNRALYYGTYGGKSKYMTPYEGPVVGKDGGYLTIKKRRR